MVQPPPLRTPRFQGWERQESRCQQRELGQGEGSSSFPRLRFPNMQHPWPQTRSTSPTCKPSPTRAAGTGTRPAAPKPRGSQLGARRHREGSVTPGLHRGYSQEQGRLGQEELRGTGNRGGALGQELGTSSAGSGLTFCRWSAAQKKERNTPLTTSAKQRTRHQPAQTLPPSPTTTSQRSGGSLRECRAQVRKDTPTRSFQPNSSVETFTATFSWE